MKPHLGLGSCLWSQEMPIRRFYTCEATVCMAGSAVLGSSQRPHLHHLYRFPPNFMQSHACAEHPLCRSCCPLHALRASNTARCHGIT